MNSFVNAVRNQKSRTDNGMKAVASTGNACTDLFFKIGASRGKDIIPQFVSAFVENPEWAVRIALWARDIRQGAGERKIFRDVLQYLSFHEPEIAKRVVARIPDLGRWDDIFAAQGAARTFGFSLVGEALSRADGLCAKWMPRKGVDAAELRSFLGMTPKAYRKTLVNLTKVVETQMCSKDWDSINFNHVPSLASSRYKKAFSRHTPKYAEWASKLVSTDPKVRAEVKVNAGAVYPYDILKGLASDMNFSHRMEKFVSQDQLNHIIAQWDALPNFVGDASILPMVDTSGSMESLVSSKLRAIDVSVSLGLYLADKNRGPFKDVFLTFSGESQLVQLQGNVVQKLTQMCSKNWGMNTNLHRAFEKILETAKAHNVPHEDMPKIVLILSDMQFDRCVTFDDSAIEMIRRKYSAAGYDVPAVVFWNINSRDNAPVNYTEKGVALVSGFSPSITKSVLSVDLENFSPVGIMKKTILSDRYSF